MRFLGMAAALVFGATTAFAQETATFDCAVLVGADGIKHPDRVNLLRRFLKDESDFFESYGSPYESSDGFTTPQDFSFTTKQTKLISENCVRIIGNLKLSKEINSPDNEIPKPIQYTPLQASIFVLADKTSTFMEEYQNASPITNSQVRAYIDEQGFQLPPKTTSDQSDRGVKSHILDNFKISAFVKNKKPQTTIDAENHWFAAVLVRGEDPQLIGVICEESCDKFSKEPEYPLIESATAKIQETAAVPVPNTIVVSGPDPTFEIHIADGKNHTLRWSELIEGSNPAHIEDISSVVDHLRSDQYEKRRIALEKLVNLPGFPKDNGVTSPDDLEFESFSEEATLRLLLSKNVSKVVKTIQLVLSETSPSTQSLLHKCELNGKLYKNEKLIKENLVFNIDPDEAPYYRTWKMSLPDELIEAQEGAVNKGADTSLSMIVETVTDEGSEPSCRITWDNDVPSDTRVALWQEEGADNYSFDSDTGVAQFTNVVMRSTLDPVHIVVFNKTGPVDASGLPTEAARYPNWVAAEDNHLMEETLDILLNEAISELENQASEVFLSYGKEDKRSQDFTQFEVAQDTIIDSAIKPVIGGFGVEALSKNLSETRNALEDSNPKIVILGRTGLAARIDYCASAPEELLGSSSEAILVDFVPDQSMEVMEDHTLEKSFPDGAPQVLAELNSRLPIAKCPRPNNSQLEHWVIFVDARSRGFSNRLEKFAEYIFGDQG